jgi:hypothetical protein
MSDEPIGLFTNDPPPTSNGRLTESVESKERTESSDDAERARLTRLFAVADQCINAGCEVLPVAVWVKDDTTVAKAPLLAHAHLQAHRDPRLIRQQLVSPPHVSDRVPPGFEVAVGFVPGSGGFLVLDCDVKHGKAGLESLRALQHEFGDFATAAWVTPSGGVNVLLRKPPGAEFSNHSPWEGIDVRADGGWVVAPGNRCKGGEWRWIDRPTAST